LQVSVYGISGQLVSSEKAINSSVSIPVLKGVYLVKVENQVAKVIVK